MFGSSTMITAVVAACLLTSSALARPQSGGQSVSVILYMFNLGNEGSQQQQLGGPVQSNGGCTNLDGAVGQDTRLQTGIQVSTPQAGECVTFYSDDYCSSDGTALPVGPIQALPGNAPILSFSVDSC